LELLVTKKISDILKLINQLLHPCDKTLPVNTYEANKFLNSMGLEYEKISACHNDCMLFWKDNKDLDSCTVCGESKWRTDTHLDEDDEVISLRKKTSGEGIEVVSIHFTATEVIHV
jgi:hypothetical protein